jgi:polar amino acid transport system substrate-binding protein
MFNRWKIITIMLLVSFAAAPLFAETLFRVAYPDKENPPRIVGDGISVNSQTPGITVELLRMVGKATGVTVEFKRAPWSRCLYMLEHGLTDAIFHASYSEERAEFGVYPMNDGKPDSDRAIYTNRYVLYSKKGEGVSWDGQTISNASYPIGTQINYAISDNLREMGYIVEEERGIRPNFDKLSAGRISAYAEIETIAEGYLDKYRTQYQDVEKLLPPLREKDYYLLVSRRFNQQHPDLTEAIFDAVRDVQSEYEYEILLNKYR